MANGASERVSFESIDDPRWTAVKRAADSPQFVRATLLRDFLLYISWHALSGRTEEITEQKIGHRVYRRNELYSPADDNIVRVSARQLRVKLREYYETEGERAPWIIEIPKGNYVPLFRKRDAHQAISGRFNWTTLSKWLAAAAMLALAAWLVWSHVSRAHTLPRGANTQANLVTSIFHDASEPVDVVMSDEALVLMQSMIGRRFTLDEYTNQSYRQVPPMFKGNPEEEHLWKVLTARQIINLGDAGVSTRIRDALLQLGPSPNVEVRSAQNMRPRDFLSGNFILLGESSSDPWGEMFGENRFNFQFSPDITLSPRPILNTNPRPGEQKTYMADFAHHRSYARIVYISNPTHTGKVLLIGGTSMEGTEAAAEFCLQPDSVAILRKNLKISTANPLPEFEMLVVTSTEGGAGVAAQIVSSRIIGVTQ